MVFELGGKSGVLLSFRCVYVWEQLAEQAQHASRHSRTQMLPPGPALRRCQCTHMHTLLLPIPLPPSSLVSGDIDFEEFKQLVYDGMLLEGAIQDYEDAFNAVDDSGNGSIGARGTVSDSGGQSGTAGDSACT